MITGKELTDNLIHAVVEGTTNGALKNEYERYINSALFSSIYGVTELAFSYLVSHNEKLAKDVVGAISRYQITVNSSDEMRPLDFVQLPSWYMWTMQKESSDYFDPNGEYYQLRINDVINCYLIAQSLEV